MRPLLRLALLVPALALGACGAGSGICDCSDTQICRLGRCFDNVCAAPASQRSAFPECSGGVFANCAQSKGVNPVGRRVFFDVPAGAASITVELQAVGSPVKQLRIRRGSTTSTIANTAVPLTIRAPDGTLWFDDVAALAADPSTQLVFFPDESSSPVVGSLTIPNTTRGLEVAAAGLPAGSWDLVVSDYAYECATVAELSGRCGSAAGASSGDLAAYAAGTYDVTVVVEGGPPPATGAPMDVAFYLQRCAGSEVDAGGSCATPLTAGTAASDPDLQRMVATYGGLLGNAGITLGEVTFHDLDAAAQTRWALGLDIDAQACDVQLGQLLALSEPGNRMNLFLVPAILARTQEGDTTETVGIDGTIPGPSGLGGTVQSGAVVSAADLRARPRADSCGAGFSIDCGADFSAYIAAHETGHFLGLYHTSEQTGGEFDPIADTPTCACSACGGVSCGTANASVSTRTCTQSPVCGGGDNLMFWVVGQGSQGVVTPQQGAVMRANPLVR